MTRFLVVFALALPSFAAVDGTIMNRTTGKPQPNVIVSLVQPTQSGMQNLGSVKSDADGKFRFDKDSPGGPQLVQALFDGVMYNKMIPPGMPSTGVQVDVYDASKKPDIAQVTTDMILYQPSDTQITVNQSLFVQNTSNTTYNDPRGGTLHFYLPPEAAGKATVTVSAPGGMPIQRPAEKTAQADVYRVEYPIKPGETRFDIAYTLPASKPMIVSSKILHKEGPTRLVVPAGVVLKSDDVTPLGQEPQTKASIFEVKGKAFKAELEGTVVVPSSETPTEDDSGAPTIQQVQPRLYEKMGWILGIALAVLGLGFLLLYRSEKPEPAASTEEGAQPARERKPSRKGAVSR